MSETGIPERDAYLEHLVETLSLAGSHKSAMLTVAHLLEKAAALRMEVVAGASGLDRCLDSAKIQKPGLALAGFLKYLDSARVQVMGRPEVEFLAQMGAKRQADVLEPIMVQGVCCFLLTRSQKPPVVMKQLADRYNVPVLVSPLNGFDVVEGLLHLLEKNMAPRVNIHANLLSVHGLGVLVMGKSGVGKSECALDLIIRGHQLVADDMAYIWRTNSGQLRGRGSELLRYHMEIRGMGIINVRDLFSLTSVVDEHKVEFGIYLEQWDPQWAYQCLGLEMETITILGVQVPLLRLPVAPGRNLANLIEVASRNYRLRSGGTDSARTATKRLQEILEEKGRA